MNSDITTLTEFDKEQKKILKAIRKPLPKKPREQLSTGIMTLRQLREATIRGELVIDKVCTLIYPLNDPRTEPDRKALYLAQEELMMEYAKLDREEANS